MQNKIINPLCVEFFWGNIMYICIFYQFLWKKPSRKKTSTHWSCLSRVWPLTPWQCKEGLRTPCKLSEISIIEAEWHIYSPGDYAIIGSDNGLMPFRRQAIIWTNADSFSIEPLGTYLREIGIWEYSNFYSIKINLKMSERCQPLCLGLNV